MTRIAETRIPTARIPMTMLAAALVWASPAVAGDQASMPDLHTLLMDKFDAMNTMNQGIFREDVTPLVSSYFPVGQPMVQTKKILSEQKLGTLTPFKGTNDPGMGTMFVTKFDLTSHLFSHVYVVLDFDFEGPAPEMKIKAMKAYVRASNM